MRAPESPAEVSHETHERACHARGYQEAAAVAVPNWAWTKGRYLRLFGIVAAALVDVGNDWRSYLRHELKQSRL